MPTRFKPILSIAALAFAAPCVWGRLVPASAPALPIAALEAKLDAELEKGEEFHPIFVRFEDQVFPKGGDYEKFAAANEGRKRSELRREILSSLKSKAERSYASAADEIDGLIRQRQLRQISRFWIVNGFAANARPEACKALAARPEVAYVYLQRNPGNTRQNRPEATVPSLSGPFYEATKKVEESSAKSPSRTEATLPWNLTRIAADKAWSEGARGQGIVVAINDGGVDPVPALMPSFWRNPKESLNGKDDDGNGYIDDRFGYDFRTNSGHVFGGSGQFHGTMCAGIVAGRPAGEPKLQTGVAPESKIMVLSGMGLLSNFEYALDNGADVISMSWMWINIELGHYRGVFRLALEHLAAAGIVPVGGAGNFATSAPEGKQIALPKDIPCCLSVAGIQADGKRPAFSSKGPVSWKGVRFYDDYPELQKPDFSAPNGQFPVWVLAAGLPDRGWKTEWTGKEGEALLIGPQGNSFAGPHAAGVAALVLSANRELTPWQIEKIIEETCEDLETPGWDKESGAGLINAHRAVLKAKSIKK